MNEVASSTLPPLLARFAGDRITVADTLSADVEAYDIAVLWNYRKIVRSVERYRNLVVCHASALPQDAGMAPIYHTIARQRSNVTISAIRVAEKVDSGDVVARVRFPMRPDYTAPVIRGWIEDLSLEVIGELANGSRIRTMRGRPQHGERNVNPLRRPEQSRVDGNTTLYDAIPHLRACEPQHPAFVEYEGVRYLIDVRPAVPPSFPVAAFEYYD